MPAFALRSGATLKGTVVEPVPLLDERADVQVNVRLKLDDTLLRKDMRDDFAFACVFGSVAGVEDAATYGDKGIVELGLEGAVSMAVDDAEGFGVRNRHVIWSQTNQGTWRVPVNWVCVS